MSEIDPELDATWRAASREQPPAALDAAIRAAARREVGAKPGGFRAAPRWWPLAAVATVAAIAVGIVQMTPPEEVTPAAITAANNVTADTAPREGKPETDKPSANQPQLEAAGHAASSDAAKRELKPDGDKPIVNERQREAPTSVAEPEALRDASRPTAKQLRRGAIDENDRGVLAQNRSDGFANAPGREAPGPAAAPEAPRDASKALAKEQRLGEAEKNDRDVLARNRADSYAAAPSGQFQEKKTLDSRQVPPQRVEEAPERGQDFKQKAELAAASSAPRPNPAVSTPPASSVARNELQPFPAAPAPAESGVSGAPSQMAAAPPPSAPASVATPPRASAPAPATISSKLAAQPSAADALSGNIASTGAGNAEPAPAKDAAAMGKITGGMADKVTAERRKDLAPLAPDEWIKRIRRLIAEGKNEDAAKELLAFRREYKDRSETLLPSDLRAFRQ
jgi:hypothetical protein